MVSPDPDNELDTTQRQRLFLAGIDYLSSRRTPAGHRRHLVILPEGTEVELTDAEIEDDLSQLQPSFSTETESATESIALDIERRTRLFTYGLDYLGSTTDHQSHTRHQIQLPGASTWSLSLDELDTVLARLAAGETLAWARAPLPRLEVWAHTAAEATQQAERLAHLLTGEIEFAPPQTDGNAWVVVGQPPQNTNNSE